jgi:Tol biopolymer transport system component
MELVDAQRGLRRVAAVVLVAVGWASDAAFAVASPVTSMVAQGSNPSISGTGRFVAYEAGGGIYLRDTLAGTTEQVDISTAGDPANGFSNHPQVSARGRYVAFNSDATNLVPHDDNDFADVFLRDRRLGTTTIVPKVTSYVYGEWVMSETGRYFLYSPPGYSFDINRYDRKTGRRISSFIGNDQSHAIGISNDGRTTLAWGTNTGYRIWKPLTNRFRRFDQALGGGYANGQVFADALSADGRVVMFDSAATNLIGHDTNGTRDVFVRNLRTHQTRRISVGGTHHKRQANNKSAGMALSMHGAYALFSSRATNLVGSDTNGKIDLFLRDRSHHTTRRCTVSTSGVEANRSTLVGDLSLDGAFAAFFSRATNLVPNDNDGTGDIFGRGPGC